MIQKTPQQDSYRDSVRLPANLGQPYHRPNLIGRIGEQVRLLWGPRSLFLGLAIAWLSFGGGRFILSQLNRTQTEATQSSASTSQSPVAASSSAVDSQSVTVQSAKLGTVEDTLTLTGTVVPKELVTVSPALSGVSVVDMKARVGDRVQAGQILAVLDNRVLRAALAQAEANLAQAEAQITQLEAQFTQADILRQAAVSDIERYSTLYQRGAISQEQLGEKQIQAAAAQEGIAVSASNIDSARANVASKFAEIERIQAQLAQTVVVSPVAGIVSEKLATIGSASGAPLYSIIAKGQMDLALTPSQQQLEKIDIGTTAIVSATAKKNGTSLSQSTDAVRGSVYAIEPTLDAQNRQATVKVSLEATERMKPGMFLQAELMVSTRRSVVVPASAVVAQPNGSAIVYTVADNNRVKANSVQTSQIFSTPNTASESSEQVEILSGLSAGSQVVVSGANYLQDGDSIQVVSNTAPDTAPDNTAPDNTAPDNTSP